MNPQNSSRIERAFGYWGKEFSEMFKESRFVMTSPYKIQNASQYTFQTYYNRSYVTIQNALLDFVQCLKDFYYHHDLDWIIRTTEDCFVDLKRLPEFIRSMNSQYDGKKDLVIKGHLIKSKGSFFYLHGGSGWIMSRAAAKHFIDNESKYISYFLSCSPKGDDTITYNISQIAGIPADSMSSEVFLGTPFDENSIDILKNSYFTNTSICTNWANSLKPKMDFSKIIFWHSGRSDMLPVIDGFRIMREMPKNLYIEFSKFFGYLCY